MSASPRRLVAFVPDLMDRSRISGAAGGWTVTVVVGVDALVAAIAEAPDLVLVDLARPGVLDALVATETGATRVIGFGPHVDDDLLARARTAGLDEVLPRSQFFRRLDAFLS